MLILNINLRMTRTLHKMFKRSFHRFLTTTSLSAKKLKSTTSFYHLNLKKPAVTEEKDLPQATPFLSQIKESLELEKVKQVNAANQSKKTKGPTSLKREIDDIQVMNPDRILLVQVGMFYEIYGNYVDEIAEILGLRIGIHKGAEGSDHRFSRFAGFPTVSLRSHLNVLLQHGKTVAIVDQTKPNPASDVIVRKVTRIITPGTLMDDSDLKNDENNFLLSIYPKEGQKSFGLAWIDVSTGEFNISSCNQKQLADELTRIQPNEVLVSPDLGQEPLSILKEAGPLVTTRPTHIYTSDSSQAQLANLIISNDPSKLIFASRPKDVIKGLKPLQAEAAGALLSYLEEIFPSSKPSIRSPIELATNDTMILDSRTVESLEITKTQRENNRRGSLLYTLDKTKTAVGHRLLASRLKAPSTVPDEINRRLDLIDVFHSDKYLLHTIIDLLSECKDVERSLQRIHLETGAPSDLVNIVHTLNLSDRLKKELVKKTQLLSSESSKRALNIIISKIHDLPEIYALEKTIKESASSSNKQSILGIIETGVSKELDGEREVYENLLADQESRTRDLTALFKLKCNLVVDSRLGPIVEIGKTADKTVDRIKEVVNASETLSPLSNNRSASSKIKDEVCFLHSYFL